MQRGGIRDAETDEKDVGVGVAEISHPFVFNLSGRVPQA